MSVRKCVNSPDSFCYICGEYTVLKQQLNITDFVKKVYFAYFGLKLGDEDKVWAPHKVCKRCVEDLRNWFKGKKKAFRFGIPMVWREQKNHSDDCYFCSINVKGYNSKWKRSISYPNLQSAIRPIPHGEEIPVPKAPVTLQEIPISDEEIPEQDEESSSDFEDDSSPKLFSQGEMNDLVRDLNLPKDAAELLGSRLKSRNLLLPGVSSSWFRYREKEFVTYFAQENELVYCTNVEGLMEKFKIQYDSSQWRLFIDSSKRSLKAVLLHNGGYYASIPVGHSVHLKETYENLELVLRKLKYEDYGWQVCGDFKVLCMLLGQQAGFTKYPCFLCLWDSRDRQNHWTKKSWPPRELKVGEKNVLREKLVPRQKVLLPPLHIKLGLMKQFVKSLPRDGDCFKYLLAKFPGLSEAKIKEGVFVGPDIRRLMTDQLFINTMTDPQKEGWIAFKQVIEKFLGNNKDPNYKQIVDRMLEAFKSLGCLMSLKVHFLQSHLDYFPENLGAVSEEQGERFHQDIKEMEKRYQGRWNVSMMADYCWMLQRDIPNATHKRKCTRRSLTGKKNRF